MLRQGRVLPAAMRAAGALGCRTVLKKWRLVVAAIAALLALPMLQAAAAGSTATGTRVAASGNQRPMPTAPTVDVALEVGKDGSLKVTENITVPRDQAAVMRLPLRVPSPANSADRGQREYTVRAVSVEGPSEALVVDGVFVIRASGNSIIRYTVDGAVADRSGYQEVRWAVAGGWESALQSVTGSLVLPASTLSGIDCLAGSPGAARPCTVAEVGDTGVGRFEQDGLVAGGRVEIAVRLPVGAVPANARFVPDSASAAAFAMTTPSKIAFGALAALLVAGGVYLWWVHRRERFARGASVVTTGILVVDGDRAWFASPDGALPGQLGTVVDGVADVVDVSATVVDLVVRNYLWPVEVIDGDWTLYRRNPPDENLRDFERATYQTLLPAGTDSVLLSSVRAADLDVVRGAIYAEVVRQGWFARRPDAPANAATLAGLGVGVLGILAMIVLSGTVGHALVGAAGVLAGVAVAFGSALAPARTRRGRDLISQVRGLLDYLRTVRAADIAPEDRGMVFSRGLPYAVALGETDRWLDAFAGLDPDADDTPALRWFGAAADAHPGGPQRLRSFLQALEGVLTSGPRTRGESEAAGSKP